MSKVYFKRENISRIQASLLNVRGCKQSACRETREPLTSPELLALAETVWWTSEGCVSNKPPLEPGTTPESSGITRNSANKGNTKVSGCNSTRLITFYLQSCQDRQQEQSAALV